MLPRVIKIEVLPGARGATRLGPFVWIVSDGTAVQYQAMGGTEQRRVSVDGPVHRIGSAGGDLVMTTATRTVRCSPPEWSPIPLDVGDDVRLFDGDQVVWLIGDGLAHQVREHHLYPPVEVDAMLATVIGDELWWVTPGGSIQSSTRRSLGSIEGEKPERAVGCAGWLWLAAGSTLTRRSMADAAAGRPLESPVGPVGHLICAGGVLVGASDRRVFLYDPAGVISPAVVDPGIPADIVALVPGPDLVRVVTDGGEAAIVRLD